MDSTRRMKIGPSFVNRICLERRNFIGIIQEFHRKQFICTRKTQRKRKKNSCSKQNLTFFVIKWYETCFFLKKTNFVCFDNLQNQHKARLQYKTLLLFARILRFVSAVPNIMPSWHDGASSLSSEDTAHGIKRSISRRYGNANSTNCRFGCHLEHSMDDRFHIQVFGQSSPNISLTCLI